MKYNVCFSGYASFSTEVEAEDAEDAIEFGYDKSPFICAQCAGWGQDYSLEIPDTWDVDVVYDDKGNEVYNGEK